MLSKPLAFVVWGFNVYDDRWQSVLVVMKRFRIGWMGDRVCSNRCSKCWVKYVVQLTTVLYMVSQRLPFNIQLIAGLDIGWRGVECEVTDATKAGLNTCMLCSLPQHSTCWVKGNHSIFSCDNRVGYYVSAQSSQSVTVMARHRVERGQWIWIACFLPKIHCTWAVVVVFLISEAVERLLYLYSSDLHCS